MKENLLVLNRNIESEDIDSVALAIKKISTSSENQFNELKKERWFNRLFNMITFSNKKNIRLAEQISTLAQAQEILVRILLLLSEKSLEISELVKNNTKDIERTLENIVCIELISRGYEVKIGKVKDKEIDFIAKKGKELSYYQISYIMGDEKTREREFGVYKSITDNFPKYVLSMDHFNFSQDGIIHKNIIDFLLENEGTR